nr:glycosyltransferase [Petropleomorpha daqingensis]
MVVPARDEVALLPACLAALREAAAHPARSGVPVVVVVVADGCTDATAEVAAAAGVVVLEGGSGNVGAARDAGARWLLADAVAAGIAPERLWLATTDADSTVAPDWVLLHEIAAASGSDAVVGTVAVDDWTGVPAAAAAAFERAYGAWRDAGPAAVHPHVHGANLGVRGSAYVACGGFPPLPVGEDVALVRALEASGAVVLRTAASPVRTSARRRPRARGGVGDDIDRLASGYDLG